MTRKRLRLFAAAALITACSIVGALLILVATTPDPAWLSAADPSTTAVIERGRARGVTMDWRPIPYASMGDEIKLAVLVSEDIRFFDHRGFDAHEMRVAFKEALTGKRLRGASTITQQLARNLWLSNDRTMMRKVKEAAITWRLERTLPKRRILELYLNTAPFGADIVGAEAAARRYYGLPVRELSREQAARLAATLPAPTKWYPGSDSPKAARQTMRILERMNWPTGLRKRL